MRSHEHGLLWPRLTSAAPSQPVTELIVLAFVPGRGGRSPGISSRSVAPHLPDLPQASLGVSGFAVACQLTHCLRPTIRFLFVRSWLWLRLLSDLTSR